MRVNGNFLKVRFRTATTFRRVSAVSQERTVPGRFQNRRHHL